METMYTIIPIRARQRASTTRLAGRRSAWLAAVALGAALLTGFATPARAAPENPYQGKVAVITGTSSGLGKELAKQAADRGMKLVLVDINLAPSVKLAQRIESNGGEAEAVKVDLAQAAQRGNAIEAALRRFGRIDYLFNNAGYSYLAQHEQMDLEQAHHLFEVNYWAYADLARRVIPIMKEQGGGTILNVASILGHVPAGPDRGLSQYSASKHAVVGLTKTVARELEPHGIAMHVASMGGMATNIARNSVGPLADGARDRADDWQDPAIVAEEIFDRLPDLDQVAFFPGYVDPPE